MPALRRRISRAPAVRALRANMVKRVLAKTGAGRESRVLSLGCGIGDTELYWLRMCAKWSAWIFHRHAIRQATQDAASAGIANARFEEGSPESIHDQSVMASSMLSSRFSTASSARCSSGRRAGADPRATHSRRQVLFARSQPAAAFRHGGSILFRG
jgi:hypothetical protein